MRNMENKDHLLEMILIDLHACLSYTQNRESDLLCLMEQYIKGNLDNRPHLLSQIRACMDGEEYPNPYLAYQQYSETDIRLLEQLLTGYCEDMQNSDNKELVIVNLISVLNDLQDKCCGQLFDEWRKEHLVQYIKVVAKTEGFKTAQFLIDKKSRW